MKRTPARLLLAALVAVFAFASFVDAAPRKVHHRARHSSRVSRSTTPGKRTHRATRKHHTAKSHTARKHTRHVRTKPR